MKFVTIFDYVPERTPMDDSTITEPDLSFSVQELFERMAKGYPLTANTIPTYYEEGEDIDNPDPSQRPGFDLTDYSDAIVELESILQPVAEDSIKKSEATKNENPDNDSAVKPESESRSE